MRGAACPIVSQRCVARYIGCPLGLLFVLASCFKRVTLAKPSTSKQGNSEVYAVCTGFVGIAADVLECLLVGAVANHPSDVIEASSICVAPSSLIPVTAARLRAPMASQQGRSFLEYVRECAARFSNAQAAVICTNLFTFNAGIDPSPSVQRIEVRA